MRHSMRRTRQGWSACLAGLLVAGVLLAGVLLGAPVGAARPAEGGPAPDFALTLFSGKAFRLGDLKGKPVLVNFFASW
ncbi:MAG: redoxin domain-containing protein [candidate division NC10 bacterium]|nr:redoxin domain-containing protein [candidate division NC10 bacterium]MBI4391716.1 redoxin domain-containing protein [candidate division NC10 bacterium]